MRGALCLWALLTLPVAAQAEPPLEGWLEAAKSSPRIIFAPRLGTALEPVASGLARLRKHPAIGRLTEQSKDDIDALFGMHVFDLADHANRGLDLNGAAFLAGGVTIVGFESADQVAEYLGHALGMVIEATTLNGREAWQAEGGFAVWKDGYLYLARSREGVAPYLVPPQPPKVPTALADCPKGPGEADLWIIQRRSAFDLGRGCLTVRFDRDRIRISGRAVTPLAKVIHAYLDPNADLGPLFERLGADISALLAAQFGPKTRDRALAALATRSAAPAVRRLGAEWDGRLAAAGGPEIGEMTVLLGVEETGKARQAISTLLVDAAPKPTLKGPGWWQLTVPLPKSWPRHLPRVNSADFGVEDGMLYASTRPPAGRTKAGDLRTVRRRGRLDMSVFDKAALALFFQAAGTPGDGRAWADAIMSATTALGAAPEDIQEITSAVAFVLGHFAEMGLGLRPTADGLQFELEWVLL